MERVKTARWRRLVIGAAALFFAGLINGWSILKAPFEAYWDPAQLGINYTVMISSFCIGGFISGLLTRKTSSVFRLIVSAVLQFSGLFITSRLSGGSVFPLYLSYGVLSGLGIGFAYNTIISTTNEWFPDKQGLSSGVLLAGFGLSSLILGRVADIMGRSESIGWSNTFVISAVTTGAVALIAALLVKPPRAEIVLALRNDTPVDETDGLDANANRPDGVTDLTWRQVLKTSSFYLMFFFTAILAASGSAAISFARDIAEEVGASTGFAVTTVGLLAVCNSIGRVTTGLIFDRFSIKASRLYCGIAAIIAPATVTLALLINSFPLAIIGLCMCGYTYGIAPTSLSATSAKFYGTKHFSEIFSLLSLVLLFAPLAASLAGIIKDATGVFYLAFLILTGCSIVGFFINLFIKKPLSRV